MYNKKYEITLTVLTIMTVLMTTVGVSFSYFMPGMTGENGNVSVTTDNISSVVFDGGADFQTTTEIEPGWNESKTFTITVEPSDRSTTVYVKMDYNNGFTDLLASVSDVANGAKGDIDLATTSERKTAVLVEKTFPPSTETQTITYTLSMSFPNLNKVQNYDQGQTFEATLYAELGDSNLYYTHGSPNGTTVRPNAQ